MNDEAARQGRPDTNTITCPEDSRAVGYPKCENCGQRAATDELLERHKCRRCVGPIPAWRPWNAPRGEDVAA